MHVETAESHLLEHFDLPQQLIFVQRTVPRPERGASVFGSGVFEKRIGERVEIVLFVDHLNSSEK